MVSSGTARPEQTRYHGGSEIEAVATAFRTRTSGCSPTFQSGVSGGTETPLETLLTRRLLERHFFTGNH